MSSGWMSRTLSSRTADSPSCLIFCSRSALTDSTMSSIRAGWIRPSVTSFWMDRRASSRRMGSKLDRMTASGVSSTMMSTPVAISKARMFRPSRPMIRPFMSSEGRSTTETVVSTTCSAADRWMALDMISRADWAAFSRASSSIRRTVAMASSLASSSIFLISMALASSWVIPDTRSSSSMAFWMAAAIFASSTSSSFSFWVRRRSFCEKSFSFRSMDWNRRSRFSSLLRSRRSVSLILRCFSRFWASNSFCRARSFSRASRTASRLIFSASSRALSMTARASSWASTARREPSLRLSRRKTTAPRRMTITAMPA